MSRSSKSKRDRKNPFHLKQTKLRCEPLEDRSLMSCNVISGFVYYDTNNDGLYQPQTESPIANSTIELRNANNVVVGTTTTDANGMYAFDADMSLPERDETLTKTVTFPMTGTDFELTGVLEQFNPELGELQSIEITHAGAITSEIKYENISLSPSTITGTVSGSITLTAPGVNDVLDLNYEVGPLQALRYDLTTDFSGGSGGTFGENTANGSQTIELTGNDINAYIGTGTVTVTEAAVATSVGRGSGNIDTQIRSKATSTITVVYHYKTHECLEPGDYKIIQTTQPPNFLDGTESTNGTPIPNTVGTDFINVTLGDADLPNNNFGELKTAQLSGNVWHDENNDGVRQNTEDLIPGAIITLQSATGSMQKTTDANGFYEFTDLAPGTYTVKETQPADYLDGSDNAGTKGGTVVNDAAEDQIQSITLAPEDNSENNDFGEIKPASLAGHVYHDEDDDGVFDATESPIAGTTVELTGFDDLGPVSLTTTTNAAGEYEFTNLRPGTYAITETQPTDFADGKDTIGTPGGDTANDQFSAIELAAGVNGVNNNFGERKSGRISGHVWYDENNDGIRQNTEAMIPGTIVTLETANGPIQTTTDADGYYEFTNLGSGIYTIKETQPADFLDGSDNAGSLGGTVVNDPAMDQIQSITLGADEHSQDNDFGELRPASLAGHVYHDIDDDGVFDANEDPIAGTTVELTGFDDQGAVNLTTTTNADGEYEFTNLRPGTYAITETQPADYSDGKDTIGTPGGTTANDAFSGIDLAAGVNGVNNDFGELGPASLAGHVYYDIDNDGVFDANEDPIAGTTVELTGFDDQGAVNLTTTTNAAGEYEFTNLRPGTYAITETQPADYTDGKDTIGTPGGTTANDAFSGIDLAAGVNGVNNNFGELKSSRISGHVWYDENNDGIRQNTEAMIAGAVVTLQTASGPVQTTTDANGYYEFNDLDAGTYTLKETQPTGYLDGSDNAGSLGGTVVNDPAEDQIQTITLGIGQESTDNDFGEIKPASLAGHVYYDANNNGLFDASESGISGTTVELTGFDDQGPVSLTTTTNAAGEYEFTNLRPGTYAITETQPAGYDDGEDTIGTPGGTTDNDVFSAIDLPAGFDGVNNNFGEVLPDVPDEPLPKDVLPFGMMPIFSKAQLTAIPIPLSAMNPTIRAELAFLTAASITLTGHQPTTAEAIVAVQQINNGVSQAGLVDQLWASDAHRAIQAAKLYQSVLDRAPTAAENASTIQALKNGATELEIKEQLFVSAEYQQLHPTSLNLAAALYADILNVIPGTQSTQALLQSMGNATLQEAVHELLMSDASVANMIDDAYHLALRRPATAAEISTWSTPVKSGTMTLDDLTKRLLNSQEFYQLALANVTQR